MYTTYITCESIRPTVEILPHDSRPALPWKNGGGVTREVAAFPAGSDLRSFDWRVSIAEVRAAGPFSLFPGVDRRLAVLEGRLVLNVESRPQVTLAPGGAPAFFPGEVPAFGEPLQGPVLDLNVMTRRGRFKSALRSYAPGEALELDPQQGTLLVLALCDLVLRAAGSEVRLARLDAARIDCGPGGCAGTRIPAPAACYLIHLTACA
jgi:uncharacterized protein